MQTMSSQFVATDVSVTGHPMSKSGKEDILAEVFIINVYSHSSCSERLFYVSSYCANSIQSNSIVTARNRARGPLALAVHNVVH